MKQLILCLALLCPLLVWAQPKTLSIGDTLPPAILQKLLASTQQTINPVQLKNTYIILDFWATWCPACIRETPFLDTLQSQFRNNLSIIMVAAEPLQKVKTFFLKHKNIASANLAFLTSDTLLKKLFPHRYLPHQVWISPQGIVQAITGAGNASVASLQQWTNGKLPSFRLKADAPPVNQALPLFVNGNGAHESFLKYRSQFAGRLPGRGGSNGQVTANGLTRYWFINTPVLGLYQFALNFPSTRVLLEVSNPAATVLTQESSETQKDSCLYTYEITVPENTPMEKWTALMLQDCNRYLNLDGRMENRMLTCYAIRSLPGAEILLQGKNTPDPSADTPDESVWLINQQKIDMLITGLNTAYSPAPGLPVIIDETGIKTNITMKIPVRAINNTDLLQKVLAQYNLQLIKTKKVLSTFILTEPGYYTTLKTSSNE